MNTASLLSSSTAMGGSPSPVVNFRRLLRTPKGTLTLAFLPVVALAGTLAGWGVALPHLVAALVGTALADLLVTRLHSGAWRWPSSALLSGAIVAIVLGPATPWLVTLAVGALASFSKAIITTRGRHIFNPAALALLVAIP